MILGLHGVKESGKNTVADIIEEEFGNQLDIYQHSFAAKLKQSAIASIVGKVVDEEQAIRMCDDLKEFGLFELIVDPTDVETGDRHKFTGREFLQWYGTEAHRDIFGENFWTDLVIDEIHEKYGDVDDNLHLITDCRFVNEAEAIRNEGGEIVKITRPEKEDSGDKHASEKPLPPHLIDHEIMNDKDLDFLRTTVINFVQKGIVNG